MSKAKTIIHIEKKGNESGANMLRRFSRRFRDANIVRKIRDGRYMDRAQSKLKQKKSALHRIERGVEYKKLDKLGKLKPRGRRR